MKLVMVWKRQLKEEQVIHITSKLTNFGEYFRYDTILEQFDLQCVNEVQNENEFRVIIGNHQSMENFGTIVDAGSCYSEVYHLFDEIPKFFEKIDFVKLGHNNKDAGNKIEQEQFGRFLSIVIGKRDNYARAILVFDSGGIEL
jgi:hypothetical protein